MTANDTVLNETYRKLVKANFPEDIFGVLKATNQANKLQEIKHIYTKLLMEVHPDHYTNSSEEYTAKEATRILIEYYDEAKSSITNNTYGSKKVIKKEDIVELEFNVKEYRYKIFSGEIERDFCRIYFGERLSTSGPRSADNICLKVIKDKTDNDLIIKESEILKDIMHKSMPIYLDSIVLEDGKRANVLQKIEDSYDLYSVREQFGDGLPQEHAVWVMDRLLSVLGYMHTKKTIHGAIEPGNIMITPSNHNGLLIDFLLSIPKANEADAKYIGVNNYSAPEISRGAKPHPSSDMYSLGKSMIYLLGGYDENIPSKIHPEISQFIKSFIEHDPRRRKYDAWKSWHELKELRTKIFGAPSQFLELIMK